MNNINDKAKKLDNVRAFILIDDDFDRKIGLNRDIKDSVYLSRISKSDAAFLV